MAVTKKPLKPVKFLNSFPKGTKWYLNKGNRCLQKIFKSKIPNRYVRTHFFYFMNRSSDSTINANTLKFHRLLRHLIDEDTTMFDIFKLHETTLEEKSVNLNGNPSKASSNKTHFFQIGHQQNNQINGKESRSSNLLSDVLQKEKTSRKSLFSN